MTLAEYIKTMEIGKVKGLVDSLILSLVPEQKEVMTEEEKQKAIDIFSNKISELKKCLADKKEPVIAKALYLLENHDWSVMKPSLCHGDMTLENIIIRNDCLYTAISDYVLSEGGSCFGTVFTDTKDVIFQKAVNKQERDSFLGSKYVQSSIGTAYIEIGKELKNHEKVLFTGTPCQVSGLKHYLKAKKISTERLLTVDLLCHGTPSPKIWKDYVRFLENKNNARMTSYTFRNKDKGWAGYHVKAEYDNGNSECESREELTFLTIFSMDVALRPSCYECPYACRERCGDITLGDYWGIHQLDETFADNKGVSLVIPNNNLGEKLISSIFKNPLYKWKEYSNVNQPNLEHPTLKNLVTDMFWKDYQMKGFLWIIKNYGGYNNTSIVNKICRSLAYRIHAWRNKRRLR